jgi:hypothetical protein
MAVKGEEEKMKKKKKKLLYTYKGKVYPTTVHEGPEGE